MDDFGLTWMTIQVKFIRTPKTEYIFSQSGSGNNGGFNHDEPYQWTPAMVNHVRFGVELRTIHQLVMGVFRFVMTWLKLPYNILSRRQ